MKIFLTFVIFFGGLYIIFKYYDSENPLLKGVSWILGFLLVIGLLLTTKGRY